MMPATAATRSSATATARCSTTAATRCSATDAGPSPCRIALCLSALLDAAEGARADAALAAGCSVSSRRLPVSVESSGRWAGTVGNSAACAPTSVDVATVGNSAARASTSVDVAAVGNSAARAPTSVVGCSGYKTCCSGSSTCRRQKLRNRPPQLNPQ